MEGLDGSAVNGTYIPCLQGYQEIFRKLEMVHGNGAEKTVSFSF